MKVLKSLLGNIWKTYFFLVVLISLIILYPIYFVLLKNEKHFTKGFKLTRYHAKFILFFIGIRVELQGELPSFDEPLIICPNHSSYLDILILYAVTPNFFLFLGKKELQKVPIFNIFFKRMNIPIDRSNPRESLASINRVRGELDKGNSVVIFPEGTIPTTAPKMKAFKNGAFKLAMESNTSILPISFIDNWHLLEDNFGFKARNSFGKSRVFVHPVISSKEIAEMDLLTLREMVKSVIKSKINV